MNWSSAMLAAIVVMAHPCVSQAHPHILIEARSELLFDGAGRVIGVTNIWDFDEAFSAYAIQGYDSKGDGRPSRADLQPFAEINLRSLSAYDYFTRMKLDGRPIAFGEPKDYYDVFENEKLTLHFTLPLAQPLDAQGKSLELDVYDPEYFAAISFHDKDPVMLANAKPGCVTAVHRPQSLEPAIAAQLARIPADQRELPPHLLTITDKLVNAVVVTCR
jgi:ABC-type uncharacterized transport system substrate-binding protein